ncbi:hypothetical protein BDQ94DRAFT_146347 [Aspergillus welwitschiae]|uniref:Uncharacterized protein n=1 Tax=Aspergillus welwitschiae TaxID=1341132 RepID=A0A3F3PXM1_9EURO|nr:hypothetical protein BDQ94DRAFT_146347 [Aspergillus welwitschiae]RDH31641.1 hypothetical protein BDQ94DRAFT_146347 [Aspergillus welwitschiae]
MNSENLYMISDHHQSPYRLTLRASPRGGKYILTSKLCHLLDLPLCSYSLMSGYPAYG